MKHKRILFDESRVTITISRLCQQLIENHGDFSKAVLVAVQPRGVYMGNRILHELQILGFHPPHYGKLDVTFYRDDFRRREQPLLPSSNEMPFLIENKNVILLDDVLFTGRTIRAALDALLDYGRPSSVELMVLIDRAFNRQFPITPNYIGITVNTLQTQNVKVNWRELDGTDQVWLITQ